ncbi:JAB domain-containing protein similar to deubiquitination enzymes [Jatrophihabitans sp. GAS493]|uniref:ThiF family adenylyltransferase n=1 Tax=Jatrophihabitans sp. GAS493 TaxID=1907575 RepID=UPI000BB71F6B|nr:ThiF family adenylyltransferase [Jatrophihabitans sp. GAS493]SOD73526.1 JAB domain-containing protein similar to deubiquitination enzymes [Jatrophihabitans sp. GAS493]
MKIIRTIATTLADLAGATAHAIALNTHRIIAIPPAELKAPAPLVMTTSVSHEIMRTVGSQRAESGGMFGGVRGSGTVTEYHFDTTAATTGATYYPDHLFLNRLLREDWNPANINLLGFVHSHPAGSRRPSGQDLRYAQQIMDGIPELDRFLMPIAQTIPDTGHFTMHGYAVTRDKGLEQLDGTVLPARDPVDPTRFLEFDRVRDAYDLAALAGARIVAVGCGGSRGFLEEMARCGVGEFVLIDPDVVAYPNIATQHVYRSEIGMAKVDATAKAITDVSPFARVWTIRAGLDDTITDAAMRRLVFGSLPGPDVHVPTSTLLCAFTDDFYTQARVSRLGLELGVAVLGGLVYHQGRGVEITFSAPGITPACIRCATAGRYRSYLEQGYRNTVSSHGTPFYATARLNAAKHQLAIGLLTRLSRVRDVNHPSVPRVDAFLDAVAERNLILIGLDTEIGTTLGLKLFETAVAESTAGVLAADLALYRPQKPDRPDSNGYPTCPDCGGTGDLSDCVGRLGDTRVLPTSVISERSA